MIDPYRFNFGNPGAMSNLQAIEQERMYRQGLQAYYTPGVILPAGMQQGQWVDPVMLAPVRNEKRYHQLLLLCK